MQQTFRRPVRQLVGAAGLLALALAFAVTEPGDSTFARGLNWFLVLGLVALACRVPFVRLTATTTGITAHNWFSRKHVGWQDLVNVRMPESAPLLRQGLRLERLNGDYVNSAAFTKTVGDASDFADPVIHALMALRSRYSSAAD